MEQTDSCQREGVLGDCMKEDEGTKQCEGIYISTDNNDNSQRERGMRYKWRWAKGRKWRQKETLFGAMGT